jgi:hypothetical protein
VHLVQSQPEQPGGAGTPIPGAVHDPVGLPPLQVGDDLRRHEVGDLAAKGFVLGFEDISLHVLSPLIRCLALRAAVPAADRW